MRYKGLLKWGGIIGGVILVGLSLGAIGYIYTQVNAFNDVFAQNVYIEDVSVGGLTKEEVKLELEHLTQSKLEDQSLVLFKDKVETEIAYTELGVTYNIDETINEAFQLGHDESFFKRYHISKEGLEQKQNFYLTESFDHEAIKQFIKESAELFYIAPVNASINRVNKQFVTTKEKPGTELDEAATFDQVVQAISQINDKIVSVEAMTKVVEAEYTEDSFSDIQTLVSSFSTPYDNGSANRNENLKVATKKISRMLLPDEIFYLSNQLEPFTEAAGYKNAGVIVNGKIEDGLGGGVCQVASTLYNAVLLTDIEIVTRQNHSLPVSYVPLGRDATYATGIIDFQFKNNTGYPLFIEGYCENNNVYVNIYGHKSVKLPYEIKFESQVTEVIPAPATKYIDDKSLEAGKEVIETRALDGKRMKLYKLYYRNGTLEKKELINTSYYKPRAAVIKRGIKPVVEEQGPPTSPEDVAPLVPPQTANEITPPPTDPIIPQEESNLIQPDDMEEFKVIQS